MFYYDRLWEAAPRILPEEIIPGGSCITALRLRVIEKSKKLTQWPSHINLANLPIRRQQIFDLHSEFHIKNFYLIRCVPPEEYLPAI